MKQQFADMINSLNELQAYNQTLIEANKIDPGSEDDQPPAPAPIAADTTRLTQKRKREVDDHTETREASTPKDQKRAKQARTEPSKQKAPEPKIDKRFDL
jgi:hypothetical protein